MAGCARDPPAIMVSAVESAGDPVLREHGEALLVTDGFSRPVGPCFFELFWGSLVEVLVVGTARHFDVLMGLHRRLSLRLVRGIEV